MAGQEKVFTDIEIRILPRQGAGFPVELRLDGCQAFRGEMPAEIDVERLAVPTESAGDYLFELLLSGAELLRGWEQGREKDSRVRLSIHPDAAVLHGLPWEILRCQGSWIAANPGTPFSRYVETAEVWGEPPAARPMRVLAIISNPADLDFLDLLAVDAAAERRAVEAALADLGGAVEAAFLDRGATPPALEDRLHRGYAVLHFIGHARYNRARTLAALLLQHEDGSALAAGDERIAQVLRGLPNPPALAVLSPCQDAGRGADDAFAGIAQRLVQAGLPAAVALRGAMGAPARLRLLQVFYQQIADHGQVDLALNQARAALLAAGLPGFDLPLLFMRAANGRLWQDAPAGSAGFAALFAPWKRATRIFLEPGRSDILRALTCLEEEAAKGDAADEKRTRRAFHYLYDSAPEIWQSTVAALTGPVEGLSPLVQKVAEEEKRS